MKNPSVRTYISKYLRRNLVGVCAISLPIAALLFAYCWSEAEPSRFFWAVVPMAVAALWLCYCLIRACFFCRMIKRQEQRFGILFRNSNAVCLKDEPNSTLVPPIFVYLCDDWLIFPGRLAFCKQNICSISYRRGGRHNGIFIATIKTADGKKYREDFGSEKTILRIRRWL